MRSSMSHIQKENSSNHDNKLHVEEELKIDQVEFEKNLLVQLEQRIIVDEAIHGKQAVEKFTENLKAPKCSYPHC